MRFSVNVSPNRSLEGWIVPDHPAAAPSVKVVFDGEINYTVEAVHFRPQLKERGFHNTGICGFEINEITCNGFNAARRIELFDVDTGLQIYKRVARGSFLRQKFILIESNFLGRSDIPQTLADQFELAYPWLSDMPHETLVSILGVRYTNSMYIGGRLPYRGLDAQARERGFKVGAILSEPFEALAERLMSLRRSSSGESVSTAVVPSQGVTEVETAFADFDLDEFERLEQGLRNLNSEAKAFLANPLTRQLTARSKDEELEPLAAAAALQVLSELHVVGVWSEPAAFLDALAAALELNEPIEPIVPRTDGAILALADMLRASAMAEELLIEDNKVYAGVLAAMSAVVE
jgi:hypothetical protein